LGFVARNHLSGVVFSGWTSDRLCCPVEEAENLAALTGIQMALSPPRTTTTLLPWQFNLLLELVQTFMLFFICTLARSYLPVLLCSFACPVDAVCLYPDLRLFFTCLPAGFEPGTWVNIIGTTMPSQFHLISSYPRASPMVPIKIIGKSMSFSSG
jgi:hypothetical protein